RSTAGTRSVASSNFLRARSAAGGPSSLRRGGARRRRGVGRGGPGRGAGAPGPPGRLVHRRRDSAAGGPHLSRRGGGGGGGGGGLVRGGGYFGTAIRGLAAYRALEKPYLILPGASSPMAVLGYVDAMLELGEQVERGELPRPDIIVLATGSGGTLAGLSLGAA